MRIEIIRDDNDPLIKELWELLAPAKKGGKVFAFMSFDLGINGNQRGMVICLDGLTSKEIEIRKRIGTDPSSRTFNEEY